MSHLVTDHLLVSHLARVCMINDDIFNTIIFITLSG